MNSSKVLTAFLGVPALSLSLALLCVPTSSQEVTVSIFEFTFKPLCLNTKASSMDVEVTEVTCGPRISQRNG